MRKNPEKTKVSEIMSSDIKTIYALDKVETAIDVMKKHKIKKLPVIADDKIVGIITVTDISKARPDISKRFMESWMKPQWKD
jgi:CBS domain-containing protein